MHVQKVLYFNAFIIYVSICTFSEVYAYRYELIKFFVTKQSSGEVLVSVC